MTAESLQVKLQLDISDLTAGIKKVKTQLQGMADKVKQSIPKIGSESKKAKDALGKVGIETDSVKKKMAKLGDEAQSSLNGVVTQSHKVTQALKNMGTVGANVTIGADGSAVAQSTDEATTSLGAMQSTMQKILALDFFGLINDVFGASKLKDHITGLKKNLENIKNINLEKGQLNESLNRLKEELKSIKQVYREAAEEMGNTDFLFNLEGQAEEAKKNAKKIKSAIANIENEQKKLRDKVKQYILDITKTVGGLIAKLGLLSAGLLAVAGANIANSTAQFREEQVKLNSAFAAAGASADVAAQAYDGLFRFLGESTRSVEAANHLAKITTNTQNLAEWTTIAQGIYATFGDSLPIEGLTEAANETLRVGKVSSALADALNWAGISEDAMNQALQQTNNLQEREVVLRSTLNGLYQNAAQIYEQNNRAAITQNEAQARLDKTMAKIGQQTQVLVVSWINLKNTVMTVLAPAITYASAIFSVLIDKLSAAIQWLGTLVGISFKAKNIGGIVNGVTGGINDAAGGANNLTTGLNNANKAAEKLKKTTMGFDELNIVSNPNTAANANTGTGGISGTDITGLNTGAGLIGKIDEQVENIKEKIEDFFEKWKTQIAIIGTALAGLGVTKLVESLGKALGAGDKFLGILKSIKTIATNAIIITLQYSLVNEFMDSFIDGNGIKEWLKSLLVSAIGTGLLYATWGNAGLVIGLGVTAVASLKAVIDNGGIDSTESAVTALTGLATAVGAIGLAISKLNWKPLITAFTSIKTALAPVISAVGTFVAGLSAGAILAIAGIIAAIASAAYFLYENWEKVNKAVKDFFNNNIVPKLNDIKQSWENMKQAVGKVIDKIEELFKSIDWLKAVGVAFETIGGIIVGILGGAVLGTISGAIQAIESFVQAFSGIVQIVAGVVKAVVKLCTGDLQGAWDAVKKIGQGIVDVFVGMYNMTIGVVVEWVKGIIDWCTNLWDELVGHSIIPDMCEAIIDWFETLYDDTIGVIVEWVKDIIDKIKTMWNDIKSWFNSNVAPKFTKEYWNTKFDTIKQAILEKLNAAKQVATNTWNAIVTWFNTYVAPKFTKQYWLNKFDTIRQAINEKLTAAKAAVQNIWNTVAAWFNSNIAPKFTLTYWRNKFDSIRASAVEKLTAAKTTIQGTWNTIAGWFRTSVAPKFTISYWSNKFGTIKDGARAAFNGVISVVENAVNGIIRKINTLSWEIPDWVPFFGGETFGFNLSTIRIPRLATGGIATSSTLVNVGEAGREAILPLDNNTGWMDMLADKIAARQSTAPTKVVLNVDGKELGWATINNINAITKQVGGLPLAL